MWRWMLRLSPVVLFGRLLVTAPASANTRFDLSIGRPAVYPRYVDPGYGYPGYLYSGYGYPGYVYPRRVYAYPRYLYPGYAYPRYAYPRYARHAGNRGWYGTRNSRTAGHRNYGSARRYVRPVGRPARPKG